MITAIVFLPLLASLIVGLNSRRISDAAAHFITSGAMVVSAVLSFSIFMEFAHHGMFAVGTFDAVTHKVPLLTWIESGDFKANWLLRVDALTAVMLLVVTSVSAVVHLYSRGYMSHDEHQPRFMAYLSLFTFFMLMLVTADNLVQLFVGWEGVGLCSYLLIGFWFKKKEACAAAIKAFLVNRVGDIGFALGIFAVYSLTGSVQFDVIFERVEELKAAQFMFLGHEFHALTLAAILLFIGCMGKSAQIGLHTWLPDAMEGPTPVSALIHAATMVTAGVFLLVRTSPIFEAAPDALTIVTIIGATTALFAASVGMVQNDIKRVIAYSTCSQLGYMFFACGVGAYAAAIFHLMTHAFFKALLFLGAGSVIHGMSGEQDMRKMGGIWRKMPYTYAMMWIGSLALCGIPFFAGYYSKDLILEAAYAHGGVGQIAFWMGAAAAFITAFYSGRLIFMTFHGKPRADKHTMDHAHESPASMLAPLSWLVAGSLFAGALGVYMFGMTSGDTRFWQASIASHHAIELAHHVPTWVKLLPIVVGAAGLAMAYNLYMRRTDVPPALAAKFPRVYQFLLNKWYFDELYDFLFVNPAKRLGYWLWKRIDAGAIDRFGPNGAAALSQFMSKRATKLQTGYVYHYAFAMLLGVLGFVTWVVFHVL
jgi:NADH-quinone oxidoreductase subunit L